MSSGGENIAFGNAIQQFVQFFSRRHGSTCTSVNPIYRPGKPAYECDPAFPWMPLMSAEVLDSLVLRKILLRLK
jgi:hypothetical protein